MEIRIASAADAGLVAAALRQLSRDMGDHHAASDGLTIRALSAPQPACRAVIGVAGDAVLGVALFSPFLSTTRGLVGAYVSDLWVSQAARGQGLGPRLLTAVRDAMATDWGGSFLRLSVYDDNLGALRFYHRLGFRSKAGETWLTLEGAALEDLA